MQRFIYVGVWIVCLSIILVGCSGGVQQILPTATPAPTQPIPSPTPTSTPPPTVTSFPTLTPHGISEATAASTDPSGTQPAGSTAAPTQAPTSAGGLEGVNRDAQLFYAGFEQGWPTIDEATAKVSIISGKYEFKLGPFDSTFISTTAVDAENLLAEVDVNITSCPTGGGYGLLFRHKAGGNYYGLIINCGGQYTLIARVSGALAQEPVASGDLPAGVDPKSGSHVISLVTRGDSFDLYLDGKLLGQATDTRLDSGDIALYAFTESDSLIHVAFDNLEVWAVQ